MAKKTMQRARILSQERIADQIYSMWLDAAPASAAEPGQFVSIYSNDSGRLLPRPISVCETEPERGALRLVYRTAGKGTAEFSGYGRGDSLDLLGPLGSGFPLDSCRKDQRALLIGGGIGIPPMLALSKKLQGTVQIAAGYRDELFLTEELSAQGQLYIATESGSCGTKGTVLDCIRENALQADVIYACGPAPMLRAVKSYAQERQTACWVSLEERMACGIGACLACVCESVAVDAHTNVKNKRVCKEGPVFFAEDILI